MTSTSSPSIPPGSSKSGESYIGSLISITSKYEIRYEGLLYHINPQDSTIGLKNVRSYGTEGRKKDGPQIPPSGKVYEYILFRGSDIKDLKVLSSQSPQLEEQIHDPAIIQNYSPSTSPTSVGFQRQNTPALTTRAYSGAVPSHQSVNRAGSTNISQVIQNACPSLSMPVHLQGYNGLASQHSMVSSPLMVQNHMQYPGLLEPSIMMKSTSECVTPVSAIAANPLNPNSSSSLPPAQYAIPTDMLLFSSLKMPVPSQASLIPANRLIMSSIPMYGQDINIAEAPAAAKAFPDSIALRSTQSMPYPKHYAGSTSCSVLTVPPSPASNHRLSQSRPPVLSSAQKLSPDQKDVAFPTSSSSMSPPLLSTPASQPPLLPLPGLVQQHKFLTSQFNEEFDFEAMNEKFKKDEVWGHLGKGKQRYKYEGIEGNTTDISFAGKEAPAVVPEYDPKPAYRKDDFFDTISCNIRSQGGNGEKRFTERMKLDTETFGNSHTMPSLSCGGHGSGRGFYHGWGRAYGYHGREHDFMGF